MKKLFCLTVFGAASLLVSHGQVLLSGGLSYSQNFDTLGNSPNNGSSTWTDNTTLTGWYASRSYTAGTTSAYGPYAYTAVRIGDGGSNNGSVWSFGTIGNTDRALGSLGSGTVKTNVYGVRFQNDTANPLDLATVGYTGEQWRNGGNTAAQPLAFSYQVFTTPFSGVLSDNNAGWTTVTALNFVSPVTGASAVALDGNLIANRTVISPFAFSGITLNPGEEIILRWQDIDDSGNDHGLAIDDVAIAFSAVPEPASATLAGLAALGILLYRRNRV